MYIGLQLELLPTRWLWTWSFSHREDWTWLRFNVNAGPLEFCFGWYDKE